MFLMLSGLKLTVHLPYMRVAAAFFAENLLNSLEHYLFIQVQQCLQTCGLPHKAERVKTASEWAVHANCHYL